MLAEVNTNQTVAPKEIPKELSFPVDQHQPFQYDLPGPEVPYQK